MARYFAYQKIVKKVIKVGFVVLELVVGSGEQNKDGIRKKKVKFVNKFGFTKWDVRAYYCTICSNDLEHFVLACDDLWPLLTKCA